MKGYVIANITVTDPERYKLYREAAPHVIASFGGRYLVRGPDIETVEGGLPLGERFVILEFESLDRRGPSTTAPPIRTSRHTGKPLPIRTFT